jgi:hypothetical protein
VVVLFRRHAVPAMLAIAALVLLVGIGSVAAADDGGTAWTPVSHEVGEGAVGELTGHASSAPGVGDRGQDSPCVLRSDCAGALVLGGLGLVLALPVMTPSPGSAVAPATRVARSPLLLRSTLWAARLHRPPQPS